MKLYITRLSCTSYLDLCLLVWSTLNVRGNFYQELKVDFYLFFLMFVSRVAEGMIKNEKESIFYS